MRRIFLPLIFWFNLFLPNNLACVNYKPVRLLVLIIASDGDEIYIELQKIWQAYMHHNRQYMEAYFIKGNPNLSISCQVLKDTIWCKTLENPQPGILNKTIMSLEIMMSRIKSGDFDYILRADLSSFYIFPRLLDFLRVCPRSNFYSGRELLSKYASGSGFLMSSDVAELLVQSKELFLNNSTDIDDVLIGKFLIKNGMVTFRHARMDILDLAEWHSFKSDITPNIFQFRVKNNNSNLRVQDDIYIHKQLLKMFYNI